MEQSSIQAIRMDFHYDDIETLHSLLVVAGAVVVVERDLWLIEVKVEMKAKMRQTEIYFVVDVAMLAVELVEVFQVCLNSTSSYRSSHSKMFCYNEIFVPSQLAWAFWISRL